MQLSDEALRLASDELNRLAKQKLELEGYRATLDPRAAGPEAFNDQATFVENQIRWCLQGWSKAAPAVRKRLLRRTIKDIVVTRTEMLVTFWVSSEARDDAMVIEGGDADAGAAGRVVTLRRPSPPAADRNVSVGSSGNVRNGSERRT